MEKIAKSKSKNKIKGVIPQIYLKASKKEAVDIKMNKIPKKKLKFNNSNRRFGNDITNSVKNNAQCNGFRSFHKKCSSVSNQVNGGEKVNQDNNKMNSIGRNNPNNKNIEKTFSGDNLYHKKKITDVIDICNANNNIINNNKNGIPKGQSSIGHNTNVMKNSTSKFSPSATVDNPSTTISPKNKERLIKISEFRFDVAKNKNENKYSLNNSKDLINRLKNQASYLKTSITNKNHNNNKTKVINCFQLDNKENLPINKHIQNELSHCHLAKGINMLNKHETYDIEKKIIYGDKNKFNKNSYLFNEKSNNNSNNVGNKNFNNKEYELINKIKNLKTFHPNKVSNNKKSITINVNKDKGKEKEKEIIESNNNTISLHTHNTVKIEINKIYNEDKKEENENTKKNKSNNNSNAATKSKERKSTKTTKENLEVKTSTDKAVRKEKPKFEKESENKKENGDEINKNKNEENDIIDMDKEIEKEEIKNKENLSKLKINKLEKESKEENSKRLLFSVISDDNKKEPEEKKIYFDVAHIQDVQIPKDYINTIYYNLLVEESIELNPKPVHTYMKNQKEINDQMRSILVDWIIDVHHKFGFTDETLFMTILIIDRYSSLEEITRIKYQCLGITALMIACKHEEINVPKVEDFIYITDNAYTKEEVFKMENDVLSKLNFSLLYPSPIKFYEYLSIHFNFSKKYHMLGKYLMESFLLDLKYIKYKPSIISCACAYIVMKFFKMPNYRQSYDKKFYLIDENVNTIHSGYGVKDCAQDICVFVDNINNTNLLSCQKKYAKPEFECVSKLISNNKA